MVWVYLVKHVLDPKLDQRRAFNILDSAHLQRKTLALRGRDRLLLLTGQPVSHLEVVSRVDLSRDEDVGNFGAIVVHLWTPLLPHILKRCRGCYAKTNDEHIRLWI